MPLPAVKAIGSTPGGTIAAFGTPLASETIAPDDDLILHVKTSGTITTITWTDPGATPSGTPAAVLAIAMAATEERFIRVPQSLAGSNGLIAVGFVPTTGVTGEWLRS